MSGFAAISDGFVVIAAYSSSLSGASLTSRVSLEGALGATSSTSTATPFVSLAPHRQRLFRFLDGIFSSGDARSSLLKRMRGFFFKLIISFLSHKKTRLDERVNPAFVSCYYEFFSIFFVFCGIICVPCFFRQKSSHNKCNCNSNYCCYNNTPENIAA